MIEILLLDSFYFVVVVVCLIWIICFEDSLDNKMLWIRFCLLNSDLDFYDLYCSSVLGLSWSVERFV